ncbi:23S rRNA (uracil(1939)-C(5))-methyltransferase RlmD [Clostridium sp. 19966]|uniref:23S rRNA (uracil(1939)-C(5))-methyltransferase RlmD n=1 Tax=Clostridium sp. 19966 TaxID=2768166 RepID=UPI0028DDDEED|nr:23S rRNA (uracil(1939)-C(5))-methyltransferase RlmD [Clostridium sp. 19966]MDT8716082.1 23S rRNA (uracil(1939)-C(5))-methyltransferase RlmD [Clostridium sp. 19966]
MINFKKNDEITVDIVAQGYEGEGVAKPEGFPLFIPGALEGEKVKIKIIKLSKSHGFGKLIDIIEPSSSRREPTCPIYKRCGGCQLQHMSYEAQLNFKKERVKECIERIGGIKDAVIHHTLGMEKPYRYRNKVALPVGAGADNNLIGFYAARSHEIINVESCGIQHEEADSVIKLIRNWMKEFAVTGYDEKIHSGILRHVMVRKGFTTGEVMVVLVTNGKKLPHKESLVEKLKENIAGIKSIIQNINTKNSNVIMGLENIVLWGTENITDYIGEFKFSISPLSFFQVNPLQTKVLYDKALEYAALTGNEVVFDAYCGAGTISLFLTQKAKKVYGVEIIPEAIENAKENAKMNLVDNAEFLVGQAEVVIPDLINKGIKAEVVVIDPPRKGCEESLLQAIAKMAPDRIVYVSCNPATLARDLAILELLGYKTVEVQPVDMFPQTTHVECVVGIRRKDLL